MMASALLSGVPPARRGAGHPRPDGKAEGEPIVELSATTTTQPAGMRGHASLPCLPAAHRMRPPQECGAIAYTQECGAIAYTTKPLAYDPSQPGPRGRDRR